jgi:hypothetical protein
MCIDIFEGAESAIATKISAVKTKPQGARTIAFAEVR